MNDKVNLTPGNSDENEHEEEVDAAEIVEDFGQEYLDLNNTLDMLDAKLDEFEQRNDDLFAKFQDLLESSRQTRKELEEERQSKGASSKPEETIENTLKDTFDRLNTKDETEEGKQ